MTLSIGLLGYNEIQMVKYTSEYILKLQIHQHFLSLGFSASIGALSISEEVAGFFLYGFPEDKYFCLL